MHQRSCRTRSSTARSCGSPVRPPYYPVPQRDARVEGWVVVAVVVTPEGIVADAKVMASSDFEPPALTAAAGSRYTRPRRAGRSAWAFYCQPIEFHIFRGPG